MSNYELDLQLCLSIYFGARLRQDQFQNSVIDSEPWSNVKLGTQKPPRAIETPSGHRNLSSFRDLDRADRYSEKRTSRGTYFTAVLRTLSTRGGWEFSGIPKNTESPELGFFRAKCKNQKQSRKTKP